MDTGVSRPNRHKCGKKTIVIMIPRASEGTTRVKAVDVKVPTKRRKGSGDDGKDVLALLDSINTRSLFGKHVLDLWRRLVQLKPPQKKF